MGAELKYRKIYKHYLGLIKSSVLEPGDKLPTEAEIENKFQVSRVTVVSALNHLEKDGFIQRVQGSGSFVAELPASPNDEVKLVLLILSFQGQGRELLLIESIEQQFSKSGYSLLVKNSGQLADRETKIITSLKKHVAGAIIYPASPLENADIHRELFVEHFPAVYLDRYPVELPVSYVTSDNLAGGAEIGRYLISNGYDSFILCFHGLTMHSTERDRIDGFMKAASEHNIARINIKILEFGNPSYNPESVQEILDQLETYKKSNRKTAIIACNDIMAHYIMKIITENDLDTDNSLMVAGFDDLNVEKAILPFITVRQNYTEIGKQASRLLLKMIEGNADYGERITVPIKLIVP